METKHTHGEWTINRHSATTVEVGGRSIASTGGYQSNVDSEKVYNENIANAKLVSAAPDLLKALTDILDNAEFDRHIENGEQFGLSENTKQLIEKGLKALKKATE